MRSRRLTLALALAALGVTTRATALPTRSEGQLEFWVDGAAFASRQGRTWQELYWTFSPLQLQSRDSLGRGFASFRTAIQISDSTGRPVISEDWRTSAPMPDSSLAVQRSMLQLDQLSVPDLKPGRHRLRFVLTDLVSGRQGQVEADIEVPRFPQDSLAVSHIELAAGIEADSTPSRFRKGGLTVRPHPSRSFGDASNNRLFYYAEVYDPQGAAAVVNIAYSSAKDPTLRIVQSDTAVGRRGTTVKYGGLELGDMDNGYYRLLLKVEDGGGKVVATSQANFLVERNLLEVLPQHRRIIEEQAALEKEGGEYYSRIGLIASQRELADYGRLSPAGRREFLRLFWKRRDTDPATPENEALREHIRRYMQADAEFREQSRAGSETDRGQMYVKYGQPEEVEKRLLETASHDILIWKYSTGQVLIFLDRQGVGRFELIYDKQNPSRSDPTYLRQLQIQESIN